MLTFTRRSRQTGNSGARFFSLLVSIAMITGCSSLALADSMTFGGAITQSVQDGTGPAFNNLDLNQIQTGDSYTVTLANLQPIVAPGVYHPAGAALIFSDPSAGTSEAAFDSVTLAIFPDGDFYLFGCLTTGSGCFLGNQLALAFHIPIAGLSSTNVGSEAIPGQIPMDLLEDDGVTDLHGTLTTYSYTADAPEPSTFCLLGAVTLLLAVRTRRSVAGMHHKAK